MAPDAIVINTPFNIPTADKDYQLSSSHKLCEKCQGIFFEVRLDANLLNSMGQHHQHALALGDSALSGCQLCLLIWTTEVISSQESLQNEADSKRGPISWTVGGFPKATHTDWYIEFYPVGKLNTTIYMNRLLDAPRHVTKANGSNNTGSAISLGQAKRWLSHCLETHSECAVHAKSDWVPTRLLYIEPSGSCLRLRLRDEIPPETRYVSLSHCWGKHQPLKLTKGSLKAFRSSISVHDLPKTFRDAVAVVRALGLHHMWIDSLCIVQDSVEDWRAECTVMGLVYRNALCNIAATAARDGTVGCFFDRSPRLLEDLVLTATTADSNNPPKHFIVRSNATHGLFGGHAPLYQRGWVIQEWYMAPRILHFGRDLVFWECISGAASEALPAIDDDGASAAPTTVVQQLPKAAYRKLDSAGAAEELMAAWKKLVGAYAAASLTRGGDRLPAFSAIAREMAGRWRRLLPAGEVDYLAGMWSRYLPQQLLWTVSRPDMGRSTAPARPLGGYVAPTWSWASVAMPVYTYMWDTAEGEERILMRVLDYGVDPVGDDPFLEVSGGFVRVECLLWKLPKDVGNGLDERTAQNLIPISLSLSYDEKEALWNDQMESRSHVYLAPVRVGCSDAHTEKSDGSIEVYVSIGGLVLARNEGVRGQYVRVGCFTLGLYGSTTSIKRVQGDDQLGHVGTPQYNFHDDSVRVFSMAQEYLDGLGMSEPGEEEFESNVTGRDANGWQGSPLTGRRYQAQIV